MARALEGRLLCRTYVGPSLKRNYLPTQLWRLCCAIAHQVSECARARIEHTYDGDQADSGKPLLWAIFFARSTLSRASLLAATLRPYSNVRSDDDAPKHGHPDSTACFTNWRGPGWIRTIDQTIMSRPL